MMDLESTIIGIVAGLIVGWIQSAGLSAQWRRRVKAFFQAVNLELGGPSDSVKTAFRRGEFGDDLKVNAALDEFSPKAERRVSVGRKILDVAANLIPFVSLFRK